MPENQPGVVAPDGHVFQDDERTTDEEACSWPV
jgi:hypothetical protein